MAQGRPRLAVILDEPMVMSLPRHPVVLYNPRAGFHTMPLALLALARHQDPAMVDVRIVDGRLERDPAAAVIAATRDAACLGVTALTGAPLADALAVTRAAARARPALPIVWGGWHPSLFARETVADAPITASIQGQGERPFAAVVTAVRDRQGWAGVAGVTCRTPDGEIRSTPADVPAPLDTFRAMDYGAISVERYFALKRQRQLDYVTSQGCHFRCGFCADPTVYQRTWSGLSPERVVEELAWLEQRYDVRDVAFQDETFFTHPARVLSIAEGLLAHQTRFTWMATMRADQGARLSIDAFLACRKAGLRRVMVGLESGSQAMLDWMQKDAKVDQVFELADKCRAAGIAVLCNLIVGFPGESDESVRATLQAAKRLRAYGPQFQIAMFYYRPYPGTPITTEAAASGFPLPTTLEAWADVDTVPAPWADRRLRRLIDRFVFYQRIGWAPHSIWRAPIQALARWRCAHDRYGWPLELRVLSAVRPFSPQG